MFRTKRGLHARASAKFVTLASGFRQRRGRERTAQGLRHLDHGPDDAGAAMGDRITISAKAKARGSGGALASSSRQVRRE
jgi:hypothetical protein